MTPAAAGAVKKGVHEYRHPGQEMFSHTQETAEMKMFLFQPVFSIALLVGFCFHLKVLFPPSQDYIILEGSTVKVGSS